MPAYQYTAMNQVSQEQTGVIEAENEKQARQLLRDRALFPLQLRLASGKSNQSKESGVATFLRSRRLSSKEIALFTRQFAMLLTAGLPMEESLLAVAEQTEKPRLKAMIFSVRAKVLEGHSLAASLKEHPQAFSPLFIATIAAGERSGYLDAVLLRLADYTEQQWNMRQKIKTALVYPAMMVLVAMGIVGFLLEYVVPKMIAVYAHINQALPLLTTILIAISYFVRVAGIYVLLLLILGMYCWRRALKKRASFREKTHLFLLRLPLLGHAIKTADTARFARTLSILSGAGVPVIEAMGISAQLISNIPIRKAVEESVLRVREGTSISLALKQTGYFPPMSVHMMASGEASGQLENMLERVAKNQEGDIVRLIDVSLALFEPAIILIMGAIVLFIVLAVLLPIFELNQF